MYEKILEKLKNQREKTSNVSDRTLEDMAKTYAIIIADEAALEKANFTDTIKSIDGNLNNYTSKAVEDARKKQLEELKKEVIPGTPPVTDPLKKTPDDIKSLIMEAISPLVEKISTFEKEKAVQTRHELLNAEIKNTPEIYKNVTLASFKRMNFETEEAFNSYLEEVKTSAKEAIQIGKESNLSFGTPSGEIRKPDPDEVSPEMQKAIDNATKKTEEKKPF